VRAARETQGQYEAKVRAWAQAKFKEYLRQQHEDRERRGRWVATVLGWPEDDWAARTLWAWEFAIHEATPPPDVPVP
jgi:hypothetical protein